MSNSVALVRSLAADLAEGQNEAEFGLKGFRQESHLRSSRRPCKLKHEESKKKEDSFQWYGQDQGV